jgi:hypothetical protein
LVTRPRRSPRGTGRRYASFTALLGKQSYPSLVADDHRFWRVREGVSGRLAVGRRMRLPTG